MPHTISDLLTRMRLVHPASPRLVWHGQEGRIELSGRVFDNWVAKTSNLLVDELDAVPGSVVELDLPPHWKSLAIAFACWQVGCTVVTADGAPRAAGTPSALPDIVMSSSPVPAAAPPQLLVCVALGSLAFRWDGPLPRSAVDYAAEVRSHGDVFMGGPDGDENQTLVVMGGPALTASGLEGLITPPTPVGGDGGADAPATLLLEPGASLVHALGAALASWRQDSVLVLVEEGVQVTETMLTGERVIGRLAPA